MYKGERFNSISHLVGASFALIGGAVLVTTAAIDGEVAKIISYSVYAATLFIL
jgi:hemolysin III